MSEYVEKRKIVQAVPVGRPVVETQHDSVIHEQRGMSGGAIAALVISAIAATALITMLIVNSQQRDRDEQLAQERAAAAQQVPAQQQPQQQPQQPPVIVMPQSPPATVPVPVPAPSASAPAATAPTSVEIEVAVSSKFLDDPELRSYPIDVKVSGGVATLSAQVPNEQLKVKAERLASRVKGVTSVVNNIVVQPQ